MTRRLWAKGSGQDPGPTHLGSSQEVEKDTCWGTCIAPCPWQPGELKAVFATAASNVVSAPAKDLGRELSLVPDWPGAQPELEPWRRCDQGLGNRGRGRESPRRKTLQPLTKAMRRWGELLLLSVAVTLATIS